MKHVETLSCVTNYTNTYIMAAKDSNLMRNYSSDMGFRLEQYEINRLVDPTFIFDYYKFECFVVIQKSENPIKFNEDGNIYDEDGIIWDYNYEPISSGYIELNKDYTLNYTVRIDSSYSITRLDAIVHNPEHIFQLSYEQYNYFNASQIDSALLAFESIRIE